MCLLRCFYAVASPPYCGKFKPFGRIDCDQVVTHRSSADHAQWVERVRHRRRRQALATQALDHLLHVATTELAKPPSP